MSEPRRHQRRASGRLLITSESFAQLEPEWRALHARAGGHPFAHPAWYAAWLRHFGAESAPVFLSFRTEGEEGELAGVLALDAAQGEARTLGDPEVQDYASPLVLPGHETALAAGLCEWLDDDLTPAATLWGTPGEPALVAALSAGADSMGWDCREAPEAVCPAVDLPGDFEAYLAALPKHERHELRRKLRHLDEAGTVEFVALTGSEDALAAFDTFAALMRASRTDKDQFLTPPMEAFFRDLVGSLAAEGLLALELLRLDGALAAALLTFRCAGRTWLYNSGYDPAHSHLAVGLLSKVLSLRAAIERGDRTFDFLRGDEDYKRRLGAIPRPVVTIHLTPR